MCTSRSTKIPSNVTALSIRSCNTLTQELRTRSNVPFAQISVELFPTLPGLLNSRSVNLVPVEKDFILNEKEKRTHNMVELAWRSGSVMDCHATARGSIPGRNGLFTELHVLRKGQ